MRQMVMALFMVQIMVAAVGVMLWGAYRTLRNILGRLRNFYFLIRDRTRGVDVAGAYVNGPMNNNNGGWRMESLNRHRNEYRETPPPLYSTLAQLNQSAATAVASSVLGANRLIPSAPQFQRASTPVRSETTSNRVTLPQAIAPEVFKKSLDVSSWLAKLDYYLELSAVTDKLGTLRAFLDEECTELMRLAIPNGTNYEDAKAIMISVFKRNTKTVTDMEQQFEHAKQDADESIDLFYIRILNIATKAFADRTNEAIIEKVMCKFVKGLYSAAIKSQLQTENILEMAVLLTRAKEIETSLKRYGNEVEPKSSSQQNKVTSNNESRASTPNRDVNNNNRENASSNTSRTRTNQRPMTSGCFNCGQQGHLARDCLVGRQQMNMDASNTQMGTQMQMGQ